MRQPQCLFVMFAIVTFTTSSLLAQEAGVIQVDATGVPKGIAKKNRARCYVWHQNGEWFVQTTSGGKKHRFRGQITVSGGKVISLTRGNLEAAPRRVNRDLGWLNEARNQIDFKFATSKRRDTFEFRVDPNATNIKFQIRINGKAMPQWILIGRQSQPAPKEVFVLPAHP